MLVILCQGKHSSRITIPDRFIGVDDVDFPRQRRPFTEMLFGQPESPPCLLWFPTKQSLNTHSTLPKWALSRISTAAKSIARRSGERGSKTRPIGRSSPWASRCRPPFRARRPHPCRCCSSDYLLPCFSAGGRGVIAISTFAAPRGADSG